MSHILFDDRLTLSKRFLGGAERAVRLPAAISMPQHRIIIFAACFGFAAAAVMATTPAAACNSGSTGTSLTSASCQATATNFDSTAIGDGANSADSGTAVGRAAKAADSGTALGAGGPSAGVNGVAIGNGAGLLVSPPEGAINIGFISGRGGGAGLYSTAIGSGTSTGGQQGVAASALGSYSIAIGGGNFGVANGAFADNTFGVAVGTGAVAKGVRSTSIGAFAGANPASGNNRNSSLGEESGQNVTGSGNTFVGLAAGVAVSGDLNSSWGNSAGQSVTGSNNTAGGVSSGSTVSGSSNTAFGNSAGQHVTGDHNIAIGTTAGGNMTASNSIAIGSGSTVLASDTIAIGDGSRASNTQAVAIGTGSLAGNVRSLAFGPGAQATGNGAVAIGNHSIANVADTVSVGRKNAERRIVNVAAAVRGTDAVNLAQVHALIAASHVAAMAPVQLAALPLQERHPSAAKPVGVHPVAATPSAGGVLPMTDKSSHVAATNEADVLEPSIAGWARVNHDGNLAGSRNIVAYARHAAGSYEVVFNKPLRQCAYNATLNVPGFVSVNDGSLPNSLAVETRNRLGVLTDQGVSLDGGVLGAV